MMDNHLYNLLQQITQEHKSLWRIKNHYLADAGDCMDCQNFWGKMVDDKEKHIQELENLVRVHLK